ncbi:MAG: hypothetical protein ACTSQU_17465 [Promethearchaeota archaeon]
MSTKEQSNGLSTKKKRLIFGVSIPVFLMGLVSLFTDISSESIQSILPLFIFEIGGSVLALGIISGITNAIANILKGITGWMIVKSFETINWVEPLMGNGIRS